MLAFKITVYGISFKPVDGLDPAVIAGIAASPLGTDSLIIPVSTIHTIEKAGNIIRVVMSGTNKRYAVDPAMITTVNGVDVTALDLDDLIDLITTELGI